MTREINIEGDTGIVESEKVITELLDSSVGSGVYSFVESGLSLTPDYTEETVEISSGAAYAADDDGIYYVTPDSANTLDLESNAVNNIYLKRSPSFAVGQEVPREPYVKIGSVDTSEETVDEVNRGGHIDVVRAVFDSLFFNPQPSSEVGVEEGTVYYDEDDNALSYKTISEEVTVNIGQEMIFLARTSPGTDVENGDVVYITDSTGSVPRISLANSANNLDASTLGVATEGFSGGETGVVTVFGLINDLDTSSFDEGEALYAGTTDGELVQSVPEFPASRKKVGVVVRSHPNTGTIFVDSQPADSISEFQAVNEPGDPPAGEAVIWQSNGAGTGGDGDLVLKTTDSNGTTKTKTIGDFSAL